MSQKTIKEPIALTPETDCDQMGASLIISEKLICMYRLYVEFPISDNWSGELARWCPSLRVSKYYGHPEERRQLRIEYSRSIDQYDVVLTT
jgi:hypothetical protein